MAGGSSAPMLKAAGLWAKTSNSDKRYLTGRLGGVKVLILENRDRRSDEDPTHNLFFVEAPDKRPAGSGAQRQTDQPVAPAPVSPLRGRWRWPSSWSKPPSAGWSGSRHRRGRKLR